MPELLNPYSKTLEQDMAMEDLMRAVRQSIAAEQEAIHLCMTCVEVAGHPLARRVLTDIANKEGIHSGEFQRLLESLSDMAQASIGLEWGLSSYDLDDRPRGAGCKAQCSPQDRE